ncbi:MAG TPA: hypothetical protein VK250_11690 [Nitrososphaeraceae archaeon]|nr:hypothetical protein [Nitrososphaeraceae archaeon]
MVTYKNDKSNITDLRDITTRYVRDIRDNLTLFKKHMEYSYSNYKELSQNYSEFMREIDQQNTSNNSYIMFSKRSDY